MFDLSNYSDYDRWLNAVTEASARLDPLETAVAEVRHSCEGGDISNEQLLEVLDRQGANSSRIGQPEGSHADD
jgi:hypothetical protein